MKKTSKQPTLNTDKRDRQKKLTVLRETLLTMVAGGVYDRKQGATKLCDPTG